MGVRKHSPAVALVVLGIALTGRGLLDPTPDVFSHGAITAAPDLPVPRGVHAAAPDYFACMERADLSVLREPGVTFDNIGGAMASVEPPLEDIPEPGTPVSQASPAWREFLRVEDEFIAADVGCRQHTYERGIARIGRVVARFEAEHAADIAAVSNTGRT